MDHFDSQKYCCVHESSDFLSHVQVKAGPEVMDLKERLTRGVQAHLRAQGRELPDGKTPKGNELVWLDQDENPSIDGMIAGVRAKKHFLLFLTRGYFTSKFCRGELEAAAAAGVPIVPVFSGEDYPRKTILALLDAHRDDPEKAAAVKAAFGENLIDANNGDHADTVADDLNNKVIARFLDEV